jgi:hypothetical protein
MLLVNKNNENYIQLIDYDITIRNVYIVMQLSDNLHSLNYFIKYYDNEELYQHQIEVLLKVLFAYKKLTLKNILILDIDCSIQFYPNEPFRIKNVLITNFSSAIEYNQNKIYDTYLGRFEYSSYEYNSSFKQIQL